jgi:hypothetical protein
VWGSEGGGVIPKRTIERFWKYVDRSGECWLWTGFTMPAGYGQMVYQSRNVYAHRMSWAIAHDGEMPATGVVVFHRYTECPRHCVNPDHLIAGTPKERAELMKKNGHTNLGKSTKLTWEQVSEVRKLFASGGYSKGDLAERFGVHISTINKALRGGFANDPQCAIVVGGPMGRGRKMNYRDAEMIRERYAMGVYTMQELADIYGVDLSYISLIIAGKRWNNPPKLVEC